jgi:hypothetical protein
MNVPYNMTSNEHNSEDDNHMAKTKTQTGGVVRNMPRHNWLGEVAANVSSRVGKWEDWEKSPALKSSEERLRNYKTEESVSCSGAATLEKRTGT